MPYVGDLNKTTTPKASSSGKTPLKALTGQIGQKSATQSSGYKFSADKYNQYENDYQTWSTTGKNTPGFTSWSNQKDLDTWKSIRDGKVKAAKVGNDYYVLSNDDYKKYSKDYDVWQKTGKHSKGFEDWSNNDAIEAFRYIRDDANGYGGLNNLKASLDDELTRAVAEKYRSQWGDKYYYDVTNPDDIAAMNAGQMPAYLRRKYKTKDPVDQWLMEQGLPYGTLFNDMYSEAWNDRNERNAKRQQTYESAFNDMLSYQRGMSDLKKAMIDGASFEDALATGKFDALGDFYDSSFGKTKENDTAGDQYYKSKKTQLDPVYDRAYEAMLHNELPDDEFFDQYKESSWKSYLKQKQKWNESSLQDVFEYQAVQNAGALIQESIDPSKLVPVGKQAMKDAGYRANDDWTMFSPQVFTNKDGTQSIVLNPIREDGTVIPKADLEKIAKRRLGEAGLFGGAAGKDDQSAFIASFDTKKEARDYANSLSDAVTTYYGTSKEDFESRLEKARSAGTSEQQTMLDEAVAAGDVNAVQELIPEATREEAEQLITDDRVRTKLEEAKQYKTQLDEIDEKLSHIQDGFMGRRGPSPSRRAEWDALLKEKSEVYDQYRELVDTATGIANTTKQDAVIDAEIKANETTGSYAERPDFLEKSGSFDASEITGSDENVASVNEILNNYADGNFDKIMRGDAVSKYAGSYVHVNDPEMWRTSAFNEYYSARYMTDDEARTFSYIAQNEGADAAVKYMEELLPVLNWRNTEEVNIRMAKEAGRNPVISWLVAGLSQFASSAEGYAGFWNNFGEISGDPEARETIANDPRFNVTRKYAMVDAALAQETDSRFGSKALNYVQSMATNLRNNVMRQAASMALEALFPGVGTVFSTASVTGTVLGQSLMENMDKGVDLQKATMLAFLNAGAEALGEAISMDALLGFKENATEFVAKQAAKGIAATPGQIIRNYIFGTGLKEGGSEFATSLMSMAAEALTLGDDAEVVQFYNEAVANGSAHPFGDTALHVLAQAGSEGIAGALTGYILGGPAAINNTIRIGRAAGAETNQFRAGLETLNLLGQEEVDFRNALESKIEMAVDESGTNIESITRLQIQQDINNSTVLTEEQKNELSNIFELVGSAPGETLDADDQAKLFECVRALHQSVLDQNAKDAKAEQKASKADQRLQDYFDAVTQYQLEAQMALQAGDLQAHAAALNNLTGAIEQYKNALTERDQQQTVDEAQQTADQERENTKLGKAVQPVNAAAEKVMAWYRTLAAQTEVEIGQLEEQQKNQVLAEQETTQFLFDEIARLNSEYTQAQADGDINKVESVTQELDNYRQMFGDDIISAAVQYAVGGENGGENTSGPVGGTATAGEGNESANDVYVDQSGRNDNNQAEPSDRSGLREGAAGNGSGNESYSGESPAASWDKVNSEELFQEIAKDFNAKHGLKGMSALKSSDFEAISTPVNEVSAKALSGAIQRNGGVPVRLYRVTNPDVESPGGFFYNGEIYIRDTGTALVAFEYGHEYAHMMKAFQDAGRNVLDSMGDEGRAAYEKYCAKFGDDPNNAQNIDEFICDIHGAYEYAVQTGITLHDQLGLTTAQANQFYDAFNEVDAADSTASDFVDTIDQVATDGKPNYNYHSMNEDRAAYRQDLIDSGIAGDEGNPMSMQELDDLFNTIDSAMDIIGDNRAILDFFGDAGAETRAYKPNADPHYKLALDFSTLCRKRVLLQTIAERLQAQLGRSVSPEETVAIRKEIQKFQKEGKRVEVACALCYVEAARLKSPKVINKFLDNRGKYMLDYFAKSNSEFMTWVHDQQAKFKVEHGYPPDATKKMMSGADVKALNKLTPELRASYKPTEEEQAVIDSAVNMPREMFLVASYLTEMAKENPHIYKAYTSAVRSATRSKTQETAVPYFRGDVESVGQDLINEMNEESGFRHQSWSDFETIHLLDDIAAVIELSTRKAKVHAYTKVPNMVIVNGNTGMMLNMSLMPQGNTGIRDDNVQLADSLVRQYAEAVRNGEDTTAIQEQITELLTMDPKEGMPKDQMIPLRDRFHSTAGNIMIGINDTQIRMLLASDLIDYVIPYHTSGLNKEMRKRMGIRAWNDYTSYQNEKWNGRGQKGEAPRLNEWFNINDALNAADGNQYMREASQKYLDLCFERNLEPKFSQFLNKNADGSYSLADDAQNYWKLLIDRKMVDQATGKVIEQKPILPNFNKQDIETILNNELANPEHGDDEEVADAIINKVMSGELEISPEIRKEARELRERKRALNADSINETIEDAAGFQFSSHDINDPEAAQRMDEEYMAAVERGDMETAQRMVNERAQAVKAEVFAATDVPAYSVRRGPTPKKTIKVYKTFTLDKEGRPTALFVSSKYPLPVGVWLDAQDTFHFTDMENGHLYVPSTKNPNTQGGATGRQTELKNISEEDLAELERLGHITRDKNGEYTAQNITSLAYRPGWHAGDLPFFPQGGMKIEGSNYENVHRYNQVVFECEMAADEDYTNYDINPDGSVTYHDMQQMPFNGSYKFATNPMANSQDIGAWFISGALKINRALTEEEANQILAENGRAPQEWQQYQDSKVRKTIRQQAADDAIEQFVEMNGYMPKGKEKDKLLKSVRDEASYPYEHTVGPLDLDALGYDPTQTDGGKKLLDPVTYDDNGNIIPLSQRFNENIKDPRYSAHNLNDGSESDFWSDAVSTARQAQDLYQGGTSVAEYMANAVYDPDVANQLSAIENRNTPAPTGMTRDQRKQMYQWDRERLRALKTEDRTKLIVQRQRMLASESRAKSRQHIVHNANELRNWMNSPNVKEGKYVPNFLQESVLNALKGIDLGSTKREGGRVVQSWRKSMQDLANTITQYQLNKMSEESDPRFEGTYLELPAGFAEQLQDLAASIPEEGTNYLQDMDADRLVQLDKTLSVLKSSISKANTIHANGRKQTLAEVGEASIGELNRRKAKRESDNKIVKVVDTLFNADVLDPNSYAKRLGNAGGAMVQGIIDGFIKGTEKIHEASDFVEEMKREEGVTKKDTHKWSTTPLTVTLESGETISMTEAQAMNLYALSNRPQALQHIMNGGIELGYNRATRNNQNRAYKLTFADMDNVFSKLSDMQKSYVDRLQTYLSTTASEWGNEVSRKLYGIDLYGEENYWPIRSAKSNLATQDPEKVRAMNAIINSGFTNALNKYAKNPIMLDDVTQVFTDHIAQMSNYNGLSIPIADAMKWFNYQRRGVTGEVDYNRSVKRAVVNALGKNGTSYFINLIKDVNGLSEGSTGTALPSALVSNAKRAAVAAKLRVMIQQPTAVARAMAMVDPKYFVGLSNAHLPSVVKEMQDNAPIAWWKSQGNFDIGTGKSMRDILFGDGNAYDRTMNAMMAPAGWADDFGWALIWNAVKREQRARNKGLSEEDLMAKVVRRFTDVINETQVIDTVVHRSQIMRSKDDMVKQSTAFMSESIKTLNMLRNAVYEAQMHEPGSKGRLAKSAAAVAGSWALNAAVLALHDSLRDRDEDEDFWEMFKKKWLKEFWDNVNQINAIPYLKDVAALVKGDDVDRMDMSSLGDLVTSIQRITKAISEGDSNYTTYGLTRGLLTSIGNLLGTPVNGLVSSAETIINGIKPGSIQKKKTKGWDKAESLIEEGIDKNAARGLMKSFNSDNTATKAFSILTYDADKDGIPDFDEDEQNAIAIALGLSYDPDRDGSLQDYAVNAAEKYLKQKQKIMDDDDSTDEEYEKASESYDKYSSLFDDYFSFLGL